MAAPQPQRPATVVAQGEFPVDPASPMFVAQAVVVSALAGAGAGATLGWARRHDPFRLGINMSINFGVASLAFFGMREYLVSPILLGMRATPAHARRAEELHARLEGQAPPPDEPRTMWEVRSDRIIDSAVSGALAGGALSAFVRGPRTFLPAAFTTALLATAGQGVVNQTRVFRLEILAKRAREGTEAQSPLPADVVVEAPTAASFEDHRRPEGERRGDAPLSGRIMGVLSKVLPVRKLTDEDYLASLEKKRADVDRRIAEIDAEQLAMWTNSQERA